jgi:death-on-curing protein
VKEPVWIERRVVIALHERLLAEHGGAEGIRDEGLLDSALARPRQMFSYGECDLADLAAAYVSGIVRNHPFVDGNKRTAFMTGYVFLGRNGRRLEAGEPEAARMVLDLAASTLSEPGFAAWLRTHVKRFAQPKQKGD